ISVRIAEDLANVIDDGATRRVLPVIGKGALQNITDLNLLRGIDMAIVQADVLDYARQQNLFPGIEAWATYITKLYNEEFHLLARQEIKSVTDLANKKVNVDLRGGGTAITAARLFELLNIPATATNDDQEVALDKLRRGEIAAMAFVAGKPAPIFRSLNASDGFHFLAIPLNPAVTASYVPTRLTAADYPGVVPLDQAVDTVAVGAVLAAANLQQGTERYRNLVNFVEAFFTGFQSLLDPGHHPKWHEVSITAELPGWRRFPPAGNRVGCCVNCCFGLALWRGGRRLGREARRHIGICRSRRTRQLRLPRQYFLRVSASDRTALFDAAQVRRAQLSADRGRLGG